MKYLGIHYEVDNIPELDSEFIPLGKWMEAFLKQADYPVKVGINNSKNKRLTAYHFNCLPFLRDKYILLIKVLQWAELFFLQVFPEKPAAFSDKQEMCCEICVLSPPPPH